jgi:hypothetical protein
LDWDWFYYCWVGEVEGVRGMGKEQVWCKHCDEYKIPNELTLSEKEVNTIINIFECEWVHYLEHDEIDLLKKMKKFVKGEE